MTELQVWVLIGCVVWICVLSHKALDSRERDQAIIQALIALHLMLNSQGERDNDGHHSGEESQ